MRVKNALVIGGTDGVGRSMARRMAAQGYVVTIVGRNIEKAKHAMQQANDVDAERIQYVALDLCDLPAVAAFCDAFSEGHESLDVLVCSAGVFLPKRRVVGEVEQTFCVAALSTQLITRQLAPLLKRGEQARVIYVVGDKPSMRSSRIDFDDVMLAKRYNPLRAAQRALHAKTVLAQHYSQQLAGSVTVVAVFPGLVQSGLTRHLPRPIHCLASLSSKVFLARESKAGIFLCQADLSAVESGSIYMGGKFSTLDFDAAYQQQVVETIEHWISRSLK